MDVFDLYAKISLDTSGYEKNLNNAKKSATDYRRDVAKLAHEFKKSGMTMSDAMKKAHQEIDKSAYDMSKKVTNSIEDVEDSTQKTTKNSKNLWKRFFSTVESDGTKAIKSISASTVAMGTMIAHGIERAASAVINLGKSAIEASSDIAAENAQFTATFGELEAAANGAFASIEADTGVLSTRLRNVGTKAFSQFKGAGLDAASALGQMDEYTRLAADAAAYYDISFEAADERLRSFLRGNTEAGDAIGLFTSETQRNNKALEVYGAKWLDLTEAQRQMLMLDVADEIYRQSGVIGQASREADGWANVTGNLKEAWRQLLGVVGTPFMDGLTPVLQKLTEFFSDETVQMRIGMLAENIGNLAGKAFDGVTSLLDSLLALSNGEADSPMLDAISNLFDSIGEIASSTAENLAGLIKALTGGEEGAPDFVGNLTTFIDDMAAFLSNNADAISTVITAVTGLMLISNPFGAFIAALGLIITNWEDIRQNTMDAKTAIENFFGLDAPEGFLGGVISVISGIIGLIETAISKLASFLGMTGEGEAKIWGQGAGLAPVILQSPSGYQHISQQIGASGSTGYLATGLNYVPYDNFAATLHAGEAVLNRADATAWRAGMGSAIDYAALGEVVGQAVRAALDGVGVQIDGKRAGELLAEPVSRSIAQSAWKRRYA